jgi:hypothetical protein
MIIVFQANGHYFTKCSLFDRFYLAVLNKRAAKQSCFAPILNMYTVSEIQLVNFIKENVPDAAVKAYLKEVYPLLC